MLNSRLLCHVVVLCSEIKTQTCTQKIPHPPSYTPYGLAAQENTLSSFKGRHTSTLSRVGEGDRFFSPRVQQKSLRILYQMPGSPKKIAVTLPRGVRIKPADSKSLRETIKPGSKSIGPHPFVLRHAPARTSIMNAPIPSLAEPNIKLNKPRNRPSQSRSGSGSPSNSRPRSPKMLLETNFGSKSNKGPGFPKQKNNRNLRVGGLRARAVGKHEFENLAEAAKINLARNLARKK